MRLLFVGTSTGARGTEQHLLTLAAAMGAAGHAVEGVFRPGTFLARSARERGLAFTPGVFRNAADARGLMATWSAVRRFCPDWLVTSFGHEYWPVALLGRMLGRRVALFRHLPTPLGAWSHHLLPRVCERFIAVSEHLRRSLVAAGMPPERVQLLYNPIDVGRFRPDPSARATLRRELGVHEHEVLAGFIGSLDDNKGAFTLARAANEAMRRAPGLRMLWVGQQAAHARLEASLAPDLRARHGVRAWTDAVEALYQALDVLAVPSQWEEPFGRVSVEAQACGVPVLLSNVGGLPETLEPGVTGELVAAGAVEAWSEALVRAATLPAGERRRRAEAGRAFVVERFAPERIAREFERLLREPRRALPGPPRHPRP
jgi:glycosyltransferase involved in cell wall biosynthesis